MNFENFIPKYIRFENIVKIVAPVGISYHLIKPNSIVSVIFFVIIAFGVYKVSEVLLEKALKIGQ